MSYQKGDLKLTVQCSHPECADDRSCYIDDTKAWVSDSRERLFRHDDPNKPDWRKHGAYLPHSCDEWFIGGKAEIEAMIEDLTEAWRGMP